MQSTRDRAKHNEGSLPHQRGENDRVLIVTNSHQRLERLRFKVDLLGLRAIAAVSCRHAQAVLASEPDIALALTDASLPDGNWSHVLGHAANQSNPVPVLLITPVSTGALWSEALWRGVYDVLVEPFGVNELSRAVEGALRTSGCLTNLPRSFTHHGLTLGNYTPGHP